MDSKQVRLEAIFRWRQAVNWSPVIWLPLVIYWLLTSRFPLGIGMLIAGFMFIAFARIVVAMSHCPGCETRFRDAPSGLSEMWNEVTCATCGLSLFELRRSRAQD